MPRRILLPGNLAPLRPSTVPVSVVEDWVHMLDAEGVPFIRTDPRLGLPAIFLPGSPNHWLQVMAFVQSDTISWMTCFCKATNTDGLIAVGYPGVKDLLPVFANDRPIADRRRYAQVLLNRGGAS